MIRKFEKKDINAVMKIWKNENIRTHNFITKKYWKDNYGYIKEILPKADIIEVIFVDINNQHSGIGTSLLIR